LPLLAARERGTSHGGLRLGLLAAAACVCRPTAALALPLLAARLAAQDRRSALRFALGAGALLCLLGLSTWALWGSWVPPYQQAQRFDSPSGAALAGVLVSPSRGLFVYEPALAAALAFGAWRWRQLAQRPLFVLGAAGLASHALLLASFVHWWGGHGYGPRLFTETLFFQALVAASVAATLARSPAPGWRRALVALAVAGVVIHGAGALSKQSNRWNESPAEIDGHPERLWDWRDPQLLAWANRAPRRAPVEGESPGR